MTRWPGTIIALNLGGAVIPDVLSIYLLVKNRLFYRGLLGIITVAAIVHHVAHPVHGMGIAEPIFMPPLAAAVAAFLISRRRSPIGVDIRNHLITGYTIKKVS